MKYLKLFTYYLLLILILVSRLNTELCIYNGVVDISDHSKNNASHSHCSEEASGKIDSNDQQDNNCCIDISLAETQSNIAQSRYLPDLHFIYLPFNASAYFITLNQYFPPFLDIKQYGIAYAYNYAYGYHFQCNSVFQFVNTILLLI